MPKRTTSAATTCSQPLKAASPTLRPASKMRWSPTCSGRASATDKWVVRPTFTNMDFGPKRDATYEVTLTMREKPQQTLTGTSELTQVSYRLQAVASNPKGQTLTVGVAGLVTVECAIDRSGSGLPSRRLQRVMVNGLNQEL